MPEARPAPAELTDVQELVALVARNQIAHASVTSFAEIAHRDDIVLVPVHDLPVIDLVLLWSTVHENGIIRTFTRLAGEVSNSSTASD